MAFSAEQKQALREMIKRKGNDAYESQVGADDAFALSELADFKTLRLSELTVDQEIIDASTALYNSI